MALFTRSCTRLPRCIKNKTSIILYLGSLELSSLPPLYKNTGKAAQLPRGQYGTCYEPRSYSYQCPGLFHPTAMPRAPLVLHPPLPGLTSPSTACTIKRFRGSGASPQPAQWGPPHTAFTEKLSSTSTAVTFVPSSHAFAQAVPWGW